MLYYKLLLPNGSFFMNALFVWLFLGTFVLLLISLIKPGLLNKLIKREMSRKKSFFGFGSMLFIFFVLIGVTAPSTDPAAQVKGESVIITIVATPSPENSLELRPSASPVLIPSPSATLVPTLLPSPTVVSSPSPVIKTTPAATPRSAEVPPAVVTSCDPSYPTICLPVSGGDLDCPDIPYEDFTVVGADRHGFDRDNDGIGCES